MLTNKIINLIKIFMVAIYEKTLYNKCKLESYDL